MARIPDDVIERLKKQVSLERLLESQGVELVRHGSDLIGLCPIHDDKSPSLVVSPKKNLWHCLGACRRGGTVIDWVMATEGVSFRHAVDILLRGEPSLAAAAGNPPAPIESAAEDREVLAQVMVYYHETLKQSAEGLAYLKERGLGSQEAIEHFRLGLSNRTLAYRLPPNGTRAGLDARERLQRLGILRDSGHEHFNGSLVVPIQGESGEVLGLYGRKITPTPKLRKGTPLHLYLPGPHRGVFNLPALVASKTVILCEALLDALTFWCAGFRNVTSSYGVQGFTEDHLAAFERYGTERVLIAYDRDDAGDAAAVVLAEKLLARGIECWRIQFPRGMDANEYACKVTPAEKSLAVLVQNAVWLGKGAKPSPVQAPVSKAPTVAASPVVLDPDFIAPPPEPSRPPVEAFPLVAPPAAAKEEAPRAEPPADEVALTFEDRRYRVRGLEKNLSPSQLRVNLLVSRGEGMHVDTLELYSSRQRSAFVKQAAGELKVSEEVLGRELGRVLLRLEEVQAERLKKALEPKTKAVEVTEAAQRVALELLRDRALLTRIVSDARACGIVGEEANLLVAYLAAVSRKLDAPLAIIIQSSSAAGKTALMEAVLSLMPEEDRVKYSAMTGQSLFYMGETDLAHKILAIVEEQGAERAAYALKLLQSEGELTIASTGKDPQTGRLVTHEYRVCGPVMIFLTTTAVDIDEELLNRCLVLTVDENREQTRRIHEMQRERQTLEGLLERQARPEILKVHQDAQRLLKPLLVANPFARQLTFLDDRTRTRRDHMKYLTLIRAIALLHQYQRPIRTADHRGATVPYIEVTLDDVAVANRLAHQVLGRSLDELAPQTRRLLIALDAMVGEISGVQKMERGEVRFTRKQVRERTGWGPTQVHTHLARLVDLEYLVVHRGGNGQGYVYELVYEGQGQEGDPFLPGLIDVESLRARSAYDGHLSGSEADLSGSFRAGFGPLSEAFREGEEALPSAPGAAESGSARLVPENALPEEKSASSRRTSSRGLAAVGR